MAAKVFISHSCKDKEKTPPVGLSKDAAAARARRLEFARKVREQLHRKLKADKRFQVFLDVRGGLKAGDVWRAGLHTALRTCSAGIVLLTPESLESKWVLKEATILSWRVFLGEPVVLIPIVLGVSRAELERQGFGALDLDAIQWIEVTSSTQADIKGAVTEAVDALRTKIAGALSDARRLPPTELWIRELAERLSGIVSTAEADLRNHYLRGMCDELEIPSEDRDRFDQDPLRHIASHVLVADDDQVLRFLREAGSPDEAQRQKLSESLSALWVDATPASRLLARSKQVIAIDATEVVSARDYLIRAFCNKVDWPRVAQPTDRTGGTDAELLAEIGKLLKDIVPLDSKAKLQADIDKNGPVYVILGPGSTRPSILDAVTAAYPGVTFIVAAGAQPKDKLGAWYKRVTMLHPLLQGATREAAGIRFRNRLHKFVKGMGA